MPLWALCLALFANAVTVANVFPYAPAMVKHLGLTDDERELGFYAGFLMTAFQLGQLVSSYPLGTLADRCGRMIKRQALCLSMYGINCRS